MKKLIKAGLVFGLLLLFTGNVWALPLVGDTVKMTTDPGENYGMTVKGSGDFYNTFCVEKKEFFDPTQEYLVDSVENYATNGGYIENDSNHRGAEWNATKNRWEDEISKQSLWLYASYFDEKFGARGDTLATRVQKAIWFMEEEITDNTDWLALLAYMNISNSDQYDFAITGWDIKVVNLSQDGELKQSQLVGAPVPEPATMVLFGIGLLGLAGIGRKRAQK